MTLETIAPLSDDPAVSLPAIASCPIRPTPVKRGDGPQLHHATGHDHNETKFRWRSANVVTRQSTTIPNNRSGYMTARERGADETEKGADRAFKKVVSTRSQKAETTAGDFDRRDD